MPCDVCKGARYNRETLDVRYKGKNIHEVLEMTVEEALGFFENHEPIVKKLQTLYDVGLDYSKLGQPSTQLSGGEAQRIKLATELSRRATGRTLYLLDEPTTFLDIAHQLELAETARTLAEEGKAVVMVLHDLNLALSCAHRVAVLEEGQLRRVGAPEEIYASGVLEKVFQVRAHSVETAKGERQYLFSRL